MNTSIKPPMALPESVKPIGYAPIIMMVLGVAVMAYMLLSPSQAEKAMYQEMKLRLKDFDSAKFEGVKDRHDVICGQVNAKNSMGGM